jgi:tetratricopeptide (TPR) repeat protein
MAVSYRFHRWKIALIVVLVRWAAFAHGQSNDANSIFAQGASALKRGDAAQAVEDFQQFLHLQPNSAEGYFNLGLAQETAGQLDPALSAFHKAMALQPEMRGVRLFTGMVDYKLNRLEEAHEELEHATRSEPKDPVAWMWLGIVELAQNRAEPAAASLDKAAALDPKNLDVLYHRGRAHLLISQQTYAAMFAMSPDSWRVHEVLGQADAAAFRADEAIPEFRLAIHGAPHEPGLNEELGDACWAAGKLQEADDAYAEEIKNDSLNAVAQYKLGSLRVKRNDAAGGVPLLNRALTLDPELIDAHYYLGKAYVALHKEDSAIEQFHLTTTNPQGSEELRIMSWYQLVILFRNLHRSQESAEALVEFRRMKGERNRRQAAKFEEQGRRRDQLPQQEEIPAGDPASP